MQRLDERKRRQITKAAMRLFASKPFHEVKLDDVAAAAKVGKGTVYLYFESKEEMFRSLIQESFTNLVDGLNERLGDETHEPWAALEAVVDALARFAVDNPDLYEMTRRIPLATIQTGKRSELTALVEKILRRGVRKGVMHEAHPELTATFLPSMVRAAILFGPKQLTAEMLAGQIMRLLRKGLSNGGAR